jgi:hypothetical protein
VIKPPAELILPRVSTAFDGTNRNEQQMAIFILGCIGPAAEQAIPLLIRGLRSPDLVQQSLAHYSAQRLGDSAVGVVPELLNLFANSMSAQTWKRSLPRTLGLFGTNSAPAIPELKKSFLSETDWQMRLRLASALCRISGTETNELTQIIDGVKNPEDSGKE